MGVCFPSYNISILFLSLPILFFVPFLSSVITMVFVFFLLLSALTGISYAAVLPNLYAPITATCPSDPLVRPANGISTAESGYLSSRKANAAAGLKAWLSKTNSAFGTDILPTVALTTSGGGYRSLLTGAGVIQGFDSRDSAVGTSGVYQGLTYQAGLSGGAWLLSSFAGNNYPTISSLRDSLWKQAFAESLLVPSNLLTAGLAYAAIDADISAKQVAGFPPTITDPYGRLLSYQLLKGTDGGVATRLSSISTFSNFTTFNVPFPLITSLGVDTVDGQCIPMTNGTIYEFSPFEFGSFDAGVSAFTQTSYLGSSLSNGAPTTGSCVQNYDNLGYVLGTSSNVFNELCASIPVPSNSSSDLNEFLVAQIDKIHAVSTRDEYAIYPNPFYKYAPSSLVSSEVNLTLVDGGEANQNNPIFPLLQPSRGVKCHYRQRQFQRC